MIVSTMITYLCLFVTVFSGFRVTTADYWTQRDQLIANEESQAIGANIQLSQEEKLVNNLLMKMKNEEFINEFPTPIKFPPSRHFFESKSDIDKSKVFKFISKMPKGGALHVHDTSMSNLNYVLYNITYQDNLYMCISDDIHFKFFNQTPEDNCWSLVRNLRNKNANFDSWLMTKLTLVTNNPLDTYPDINSVWDEFRKRFGRVTPLLTYRPVFENYFYNSLEEFYKDNVNYIEVRGTLPTLYELNGTMYDCVQVLGFLKNVADKFLKNYPDFLGIKYIYAPARFVDNKTMDNYISNYKKLKKQYPDFLVGFDLVGQEDNGKPLSSFINQLLSISKIAKFYFHAGETKWSGLTDLNLVDAILLNTTRIGHGFALVKHPFLLKEVKRKQIAIEINPISNQVLNLVKDLRDHPANILISQNYPVVISSDDPGFWNASGLSYDFYETFMGMATKNADLKFLKQLAFNSLLYSSLKTVEKRNAKMKFIKIWNKFINDTLNDHFYYSVIFS